MIEILVLLNLLIGAGLLVKSFVKPKPQQVALETSSPPLSLTALPTHSLVRVWDNRSCERERQGFWFECTCGMKRAADGTTDTSFGSEANAIKSFKNHALLHKDVVTNDVWQEKYNELKAHFEKFKESCYCKESNDDLIMLERDNKQW